MRGGYDKLCGVIRSLGEDPEDGTAYVFQSVVESFKAGLLSPVFDFCDTANMSDIGWYYD